VRWCSAVVIGLGLLACNDKDSVDPVVETDDSEAVVDSDTDPVSETDPPIVPDPTGDPETVPLAGPCAQEDLYGAFLVEDLFGFAILDGTVSDGVVPITVLELMEASGECTLERRNNPFCDPPCGAGMTCTFEGTCIPFPRAQDLGTVTIGGMVEPVAMEPLVPGYNYSNTTLPYPAYAPGDLIEFRTGAGTYPGVELHGVGVTPLASSDGEVFVDPDVDLEVLWTAPPEGARSRVFFQLTIDQHGLTPVKLRCDFADDGVGVVPSSLVRGLIDFGVTGFPNATLKRQTVDSTAVGEGCMEFRVSSPIELSVDVDGFTPCRVEEQCPEGQSCDFVNEICRDD
jgi:hypothetical protein